MVAHLRSAHAKASNVPSHGRRTLRTNRTRRGTASSLRLRRRQWSHWRRDETVARSLQPVRFLHAVRGGHLATQVDLSCQPPQAKGASRLGALRDPLHLSSERTHSFGAWALDGACALSFVLDDDGQLCQPLGSSSPHERQPRSPFNSTPGLHDAAATSEPLHRARRFAQTLSEASSTS